MNFWNCITKVHEHEKGESTEGCFNCKVERLIEGLTEFEIFCFSWFRLNVSQFTFDAHLIGDLMKELELKGMTKRLFLMASNMIHENDLLISQARMRKASKEKQYE